MPKAAAMIQKPMNGAIPPLPEDKTSSYQSKSK